LMRLGVFFLPALRLEQHVGVDEHRHAGMHAKFRFASKHQRVPFDGEENFQSPRASAHGMLPTRYPAGSIVVPAQGIPACRAS
jgi:hypothetical protein